MFIGRDSELTRLAALPRGSLTTLLGTGGVGKTRLAREHVARERARGRSIAWADLAPARTRRDAIAILARALDVALTAGDEDVAVLARAASAQSSLVVADNAEQLDASARAALAELGAAAGAASILVTSREPVGIAHEIVVPISPLGEADAMALLAALASPSGDSTDAEVARAIVRRLDALPLAIELAASRLALLGGVELLGRLDRKLDVLGSGRADRPARHATLRAAIAWSWDLLDDGDRAGLVACATFAGTFDGALAVAVMGSSEHEALDRLQRLRDRSLVHARTDERGRVVLWLMESVRELARESTTAEVEARHARAVIARAEPLAEALRRGGGELDGLDRLHGDLRIVAARGGASGAEAALALSALLAVTGPLEVAADLLAAAATSTGEEIDDLLRARILVAHGDVLRALGRLDAAASALDRASSYVASGSQAAPTSRAFAIASADAARVRGSVLRTLGRSTEALVAKEQALAAYRATGDRARAGLCLGEIGAVHQTEGRLAKARGFHAEAIAIHVEEKSRRAEGVERSFLAVATHRAGDPAAAIALHEAALAIHREVRHRRLEGAELLHLAFVEHELGHVARARELFAEARATLAAAGARGLESLACVLAARLEIDESDEAAALLRLGEAASAAPPSWPRITATRNLALGHLAMRAGDPERACAAYEESLATSRDVEVGFEALTPAYLALAYARTKRPAAVVEAHLADARAAARAVESPWIGAALAILSSAAQGTAPPAIDENAAARSSEVRRALAFAGTTRALVIEDDGKRVVLPDGATIDLSRRKNVRAILVVLAKARRDHPGRALSPAELLEAGWPGERMRPDAATKRLHTAVWTLRSVGLEPYLLTEGDGYLLDPRTDLRIS